MGGIRQPEPNVDATTNLVECDWSASLDLTIPVGASDPTDWLSGYYLAKLTAGSSGKQSYILFVARDDGRPSDLVMQSSVMTFQACNRWAGACLYDFVTPGRRTSKVSFNRPYAISDMSQDLKFGAGAADFLLGGNGPPSGSEYCLTRFLEREGYDVTYCTDVDAHARGSLLANRKACLFAGHGGYWSQEMRDNASAAFESSVSLAFFGANNCRRQIRIERSQSSSDDNRVIACYKCEPLDYVGDRTDDPYNVDNDPSTDNLITVRWRDGLPNSSRVARPEVSLLGAMYDYGADRVYTDLVVANAAHWVFAGTGLAERSRFRGLCGCEVDRTHGAQPGNTEILCRSPYVGNVFGGDGCAEMTVRENERGATLFNAGTIQFAWGLDDWGAELRPSLINPAARQMTRNILGHITDADFASNEPYRSCSH